MCLRKSYLEFWLMLLDVDSIWSLGKYDKGYMVYYCRTKDCKDIKTLEAVKYDQSILNNKKYSVDCNTFR